MRMKTKRLFALGLILLLASGQVAARDYAANNKNVRERYSDIKIVGVDEVYKRLYTAGGEEILLLDARSKEEYYTSHLEEAHVAPSITDALKLLEGKPRDVKILTYCALGYRAGTLARKLVQHGYSNVESMTGSLNEWVDKGYPAFTTPFHLFPI